MPCGVCFTSTSHLVIRRYVAYRVLAGGRTRQLRRERAHTEQKMRAFHAAPQCKLRVLADDKLPVVFIVTADFAGDPSPKSASCRHSYRVWRDILSDWQMARSDTGCPFASASSIAVRYRTCWALGRKVL